jgi:Fe-S cluster assembly scaffold protein SufB
MDVWKLLETGQLQRLYATRPPAKVTHEAAIGSVDKRQMETLMAHGLTPEEAVDVIVKGILK